MSASSMLRERLRHQTGDAASRSAAVDREIRKLNARPAEPGDLFVLKETAEHSVEWAILERDPVDPRRLLAVLADTRSLLGSADVAVPAEASRGPLSLRCAFAAWLDGEALEPGMRSGLLETEHLERARGHCQQVVRGVVTGSLHGREVDDEAEYREWTLHLEQARAEAPVRLSVQGPRAPSPGAVVPIDRQPRRRSMTLPLAIVASILLVVTLGLGRQLVGMGKQVRAEMAAQRLEVARLEEERRRLEEEHRRELARLSEEQQQATLEHGQRIAELEASARPRAVANLPLVILAAGRLRGDGERVVVAPGGSHLMLILQVDDPVVYPSYRLDIRDRVTERQIWSHDALEASRLLELTVLLPLRLVPAGRYTLSLYGLGKERPQLLMERELDIATE